jgi:O-antigen/teichoic acid export membrane protein
VIRVSQLQLAVKHSIHSFIGTASVLVVNFLFAGLTIRYLGIEQAGFFITLNTVIAIAQVAGGLGIGNAAMMRISELYGQGDREICRKILGSVLLVNLCIGVVVGFCMFFLFPEIFVWSRLPDIYRKEAFNATVLSGLAFTIDQIGGSCRMLYAACQRQDIRNISMSLMGFLGGIFRIVCLRGFPSMTVAGGANCVVSLVWLCMDLYFVQRLLGRQVQLTWLWVEVRKMLRFSFWDMANNTGMGVINSADRIILTSVSGSGALPFYAISQRFYQQIHMGLAQQFSFLFPMLAATGKDVYQQVESVHDRTRWLLAVLGSLIYGVLFAVGPLILRYLISADFASKSRYCIYLMCIQGLFSCFTIANYYFHYSVGNASINAIFNLGSGCTILALALILIPRMGFIGASIAQAFIAVPVCIYLIRSMKVLRLKGNVVSYCSSYCSAILLFGVLACSTLFFGLGENADIGAHIRGVLVGLSLGSVAIGIVESTIFHSYERVESVLRAVRVMIGNV